jgi:hypothetical protein
VPDPMFVFLVSGQPHNATDNTFAKIAWLRVGELVSQIYKNRKKTGRIDTAAISPSALVSNKKRVDVCATE